MEKNKAISSKGSTQEEEASFFNANSAFRLSNSALCKEENRVLRWYILRKIKKCAKIGLTYSEFSGQFSMYTINELRRLGFTVDLQAENDGTTYTIIKW